jgi:predicted TIM-barrel fold metal-dependent hydrolase
MIDAYCHLDMSVEQPLVDLAQRMDDAGIDRALIVETWSGDNHACLRQLIASSSTRFRIAPCFRAEEAQLSVELLSSKTVRALRVKTADLQQLGEIAAILESKGKWLLPHAESGIRALAEELVRLTALHPSLSIYVPHMGWPRRDRQDDNDWHESISALRSLPNLIIGVSAIAHFSREDFPHNDVEPFAAYLLATFGRESLAAASDYPLFEKDRYAQYMQLARRWIAGGSPCLQRLEASLFGENSQIRRDERWRESVS